MAKRSADNDVLAALDEVEEAPGPAVHREYQQAPVDTLAEYQALGNEIMNRFEAGDFENVEDVPQEAVADQAEVRRKVAQAERALMIEEAKVQERRRQEFELAARERRMPRPIHASPFDSLPTEAIPMDADGRPAGTPGMHKRRVRLVDPALRKTSAQVGAMAQHGYRPVVSRVDGKPIIDRFGLLMEIEPELEGKRRAFHGRRTVTEEFANREKQVHGAIDELNREMGGDVVRPFRGSEHTAGRF